jgi:hypothetical protein
MNDINAGLPVQLLPAPFSPNLNLPDVGFESQMPAKFEKIKLTDQLAPMHLPAKDGKKDVLLSEQVKDFVFQAQSAGLNSQFSSSHR